MRTNVPFAVSVVPFFLDVSSGMFDWGRMYLCVCGGHVECKEKKVFSVGQKE